MVETWSPKREDWAELERLEGACDRPQPRCRPELLYLDDAYRRDLDAVVVAVSAEQNAVALDRTVFFATGGGQPHDTGTLTFAAASVEVVDVAKDEDGNVWHTLAQESTLPGVGEPVRGVVDWRRRHPRSCACTLPST